MKKKLWICAGLLLCAALAVPYFSAAFINQALQNSIESALSRKVRIEGGTRFRILPPPAILADNVTIHEDPTFSLEPFAYVAEIQVRPSFLALLGGKLEADSIRLTEPSVNIMRAAKGWNIQNMLAGKLRTPEIEVRNGRLNFKQGDSKSPFFLTNALVDISALSPQGDVRIYFSAEPARADRGAQGFGAFSLRGSAHIPKSGAAPTLDFDVELAPSSLHAFNFFFGARGVDFAGKLACRGRIKGPWDQAGIDASLTFEGLEPKGFLPFAGRTNQLALSGKLDIPGQRLALDTVGGDTLRIRTRARDFFQSPAGAMLIEVRDVELSKLLDLGREANAKLPAGIEGEGKFNGVVGYSWPAPPNASAKGMIWFAGAKITLPDQPVLQVPTARAIVNGDTWILSPSEIKVGETQSAVMRAEWNIRDGGLKLDVATQLLSLKGLTTGLGLLLRASDLPLLSHSQGGSWQGTLQYARTEDSDPGRWSGRLGVRNISVDLDGIPVPLSISTATVQFDPNRINVRRMRAEWDSIELEGSVTYSPEPNRPVELNLTISEANTTHLTRLLHAAHRPPAGLLEKIRLRRSSMPEWLRTRNANGHILFKALHFASGAFEPLGLDLHWHGEKLQATITSGQFSIHNQPGAVIPTGRLTTELWQPVVAYQWEGTLAGWPTESAGEKSTVDLEGSFKAFSLESDWLDTLDGEATLSLPDNPKLTVHQGKLSMESSERRRQLPLVAPYWPITLPAEP